MTASTLVVSTPDHREVAGTLLSGQTESKDLDEGVFLELRVLGRTFRTTGRNYWEALIDLRTQLEPHRLVLHCYGVLKSVYPSGMALSMGDGEKAYMLTMGRAARAADLVHILSATPADCDDFASVDEQKEYFELWLNSLSASKK